MITVVNAFWGRCGRNGRLPFVAGTPPNRPPQQSGTQANPVNTSKIPDLVMVREKPRRGSVGDPEVKLPKGRDATIGPKTGANVCERASYREMLKVSYRGGRASRYLAVASPCQLQFQKKE